MTAGTVPHTFTMMEGDIMVDDTDGTLARVYHLPVRVAPQPPMDGCDDDCGVEATLASLAVESHARTLRDDRAEWWSGHTEALVAALSIAVMGGCGDDQFAAHEAVTAALRAGVVDADVLVDVARLSAPEPA